MSKICVNCGVNSSLCRLLPDGFGINTRYECAECSTKRLAVIKGFNKVESWCKTILERLFPGTIFVKCRPPWLINPPTGHRLELDLYNENLRLALEYNGPQHYYQIEYYQQTEEKFNEQVQRDKVKTLVCQERGIRLIEIPNLKSFKEIEFHIITSCEAHGITIRDLRTLPPYEEDETSEEIIIERPKMNRTRVFKCSEFKPIDPLEVAVGKININTTYYHRLSLYQKRFTHITESFSRGGRRADLAYAQILLRSIQKMIEKMEGPHYIFHLRCTTNPLENENVIGDIIDAFGFVLEEMHPEFPQPSPETLRLNYNDGYLNIQYLYDEGLSSSAFDLIEYNLRSSIELRAFINAEFEFQTLENDLINFIGNLPSAPLLSWRDNNPAERYLAGLYQRYINFDRFTNIINVGQIDYPSEGIPNLLSVFILSRKSTMISPDKIIATDETYQAFKTPPHIKFSPLDTKIFNEGYKDLFKKKK